MRVTTLISEGGLILIFLFTRLIVVLGQDLQTFNSFQVTQSSPKQKPNQVPTATPSPAAPNASIQTPQQQNNGYVFPSAHKRLHRYLMDTVGPFSLVSAAGDAAVQQWFHNPEEWRQGAKGYGKRFASSFGGNAIQQTVSYGLAEALDLDTGFEKSKKKGFLPRLGDALVQNVTSRTTSGKRVISAPTLVGNYAGAIIPTETWYPSRYNFKDGFRQGNYSLLFGFGVNMVREFIINW